MKLHLFATAILAASFLGCSSVPNDQIGTVTSEVDSAPYSSPDPQYIVVDGQQILLGTITNPFTLTPNIWADPAHQCEYALKIDNIVTLGRFSNYRSWVINGVTVVKYGWVPMNLIPEGACQ